jgi:hypothetical protein
MKGLPTPGEGTSPIKNIGKTYFAFFVYHFALKVMDGDPQKKRTILYVYIFCTRSALLCGRSLRYPQPSVPHMAQTRFKPGTTLQEAGALTSHLHHIHNLLCNTSTMCTTSLLICTTSTTLLSYLRHTPI